MRIAGVNYPCFDCALVKKRCRKQVEIQKQVFFAIGNGKKVECGDYEEARYHGIEGVTA